nr:MAG TPA: hypothetical protein [Caudoviricetes sp.]
MKKIDTLHWLLVLLAAVILNCWLEGTANLVITILICISLIPLTVRLDKESRV